MSLISSLSTQDHINLCLTADDHDTLWVLFTPNFTIGILKIKVVSKVRRDADRKKGLNILCHVNSVSLHRGQTGQET